MSLYSAPDAHHAPDADVHHDIDAHHDVEYLPSLNPAPSYWPVLLTATMTLIPAGIVLYLWGGDSLRLLAWGLLGLGSLTSLVPVMGWCHSVIVDKWAGHFGEAAQGRDLVLGTKLFFLSEIAIFGSIFAYFFATLRHIHLDAGKFWPLDGSPAHWHVGLPAIGLGILLTSSVTCEVAHKMLLKGNKSACKDWMLVTIVLGLIFLAIQGYEWGVFVERGFTVESNVFGTVFYVLTGFHGFHVMTGLIMLLLVYGRLEIGHFSKRRHFSMQAASWYWHLVDVVWVFVFVFVYALYDAY